LQELIIDLHQIKSIAAANEAENDAFRIFLKQQDGLQIDAVVHRLNDDIAPKIDCTFCGNCCKSLMINVEEAEAVRLSEHLGTPLAELKAKYIEQSEQGQMVINSVPCGFLSGSMCTVYEYRFEGCRDFPHLHRPQFTGRLFGTLMYYSICPIIFNVVEELKNETGFRETVI